MVKNQSEQEKSYSWRFGSQRSETFSRVADLKDMMNNSITFVLSLSAFEVLVSVCMIDTAGVHLSFFCSLTKIMDFQLFSLHRPNFITRFVG